MSMWGIGGGMIIYLAGLQSVPTELYEAAEIDGAGRVASFRNVTIPLISPVIFFNLVMGIIGSFQVFTSAYVMTQGGPANASLVLRAAPLPQRLELLQDGLRSAPWPGCRSPSPWSDHAGDRRLPAGGEEQPAPWVYYASSTVGAEATAMAIAGSAPGQASWCPQERPRSAAWPSR